MKTTFEKLVIGDRFLYNGNRYTKIHVVEIQGQEYNAYSGIFGDRACTLIFLYKDDKVDDFKMSVKFEDIKPETSFTYEEIKYFKLSKTYKYNGVTEINAIDTGDRRTWLFRPETEVQECET